MAALLGRKGFELRNLDTVPVVLGAKQVRLKVLACGVCGTDLHLLRQARDFSPLGHEVCARVLETGGEARRFLPGQQVVIEDNTLCGICDECKSGRTDLCRRGFTMQGQPGMADELVLHENQLHLAEGLEPVEAAMAEPLSVAIRCLETLAPPPGSNLLIFGMGAIGLFCAAYARFRGAGRIIMAAREQDSRRNRAAEAAARDIGTDGFVYTGNSGWQEDVLALGSFASSIVAAPPAMCAQAIDLVGYGGKVLACGVTFGEGNMANLDVNAMVFQKKSLLTSIAEPGMYFPLSLQLIRSGRIDVNRVVTHTLPLSRAGELKSLYNLDSPAIKTVIIPD
jgi:threonine dehydrogenase-like Zn-dependent dehydrogenase